MTIVLKIFFISLVAFTFYHFNTNTQNPLAQPLTHIETEQNYFIALIKHDHESYLLDQERKRIQKEVEKERIHQAKLKKERDIAELKRLAVIAAKKERLRKAKEAARKKRIALARKRNRIVAKVDISQQRMKVYKGGKLLHKWKVSTGRKGFHTPTGIYQPTMLEKLHLSRQYNNAPMPYAVFFNGGIAVHGTRSLRRLGHPASHGCVRVKTSHAKQLYALVQKSGRNNSYIEIHR